MERSRGAEPCSVTLARHGPWRSPKADGSHTCRALQSTWTRVGRLTVHARVSAQRPPGGAGPVVVLVHGLTISSRYMVPTATRLATDFPVLAPDLPGFGRSTTPPYVLSVSEQADVLVAWLQALHVPKAVYLGNSLGCQILVDLAVRYPARVERLILTGPTMDPQARGPVRQLLRLLRALPRERPTLMVHILRDLLRAGVGRTVRTFASACADRIEEKLPYVQAPTLVVRGARDPIAPQQWVEEMVRWLPAGRLAVIPGAAHAVNYSAPEALVQVVRAFLRAAP